MHTKALSLLVLPFLLLALGCGDNGTASQTLTPLLGRVVAGPVSGAHVTVMPLLNTGALGTSVGSGTTDSQGYFSLNVPDDVGPAVVLAQGGEYVDEATGNTIVADNLEMASLVVLTGTEEKTANVTVATTIAARRAMVLAGSPTIDALSALENGVAMVEEYYGVQGILTTLPADLTAGAVTPGPAADYGALNAGFSQLAADRGVYLWSLISEVAQDASDGMFDGRFFGGPLYVEGPSGSGDLFTDTGGADLMGAIQTFLDEPRNASGLTTADLAVDETIDRHVVTDPDYSFCIYQPRIDVIEPPLGIVNETTEVTLRGQFPDLQGVSLVVTFGGVPGEIVKGDDEELQVVAPAVSIAGKVDVEVACETSHVHGVAPQGFEYYVPNLVPVITGVKPAAGPSVGGTLLEVTGANFDPTAIVEVGGTQAQTIARLGRTGIVVVVPAMTDGDGTGSITVRQADADGVPSVTMPGTFSYFDRDTGDGPTEAELGGEWKAYGIGHQYPDTVVLLDSDLVFTGGTFTQSANTWFATPENPEGTSLLLPASGPFRVFADGALWLKASDQPFANRAFLTEERDVFIYANDANTTGPIWLGAAIRRASGMSNASLTGTWYLGIFSHGYAMGTDPRTISSAWGTAEFDGAGHGSAGLIGAMCRADQDWEDGREPMGSELTYEVAADGTFTVTIPSPEVGGQPIVFRGSLAQARDLAVAVTAGEGQAQFLMMVPAPTGFGPPYIQGSWYGGGLSYRYEAFGLGNVFTGETLRQLDDGHGRGVAEVIARITSDEDENGGLETEVHEGETICETTGLLIGGPDDLSGFIGASGRFQVFLPANLEAHPWADAVEFMGASLLLRRPAVFSNYTIDNADYNAVGISTEYKVPGEPLSLEEENTSFRTKLSFAATTYDDETSDLVGRVGEGAGERQEKTVSRYYDGYYDVSQKDWFWEYQGPYAVFGDGRIILTMEPVELRLAASEEDTFEQVVGEIKGNADVILLRNAVNPEGASALIVLARDGNPVLDGTYNGGALRFAYGDGSEWAEAGFGSMIFDDGRVSGNGTLYVEYPNGSIDTGSDNWSNVPYATSGGVITSLGHPTGVLTGILTPDSDAFFLVDLSENYNTTLLVGLKRPSAPVESWGSYGVAGWAHDYVTNGTVPVEAAKFVSSGQWRITTSLDAVYEGDERNNTDNAVNRASLLFADNYLGVQEDGSLSWTATSPPVVGLDYWRGWLSAGGKYAFLMPADVFDGTIYADEIALHILVR